MAHNLDSYYPFITTGIQGHALQKYPVLGLEVDTQRVLCCCTSGLITPAVAFLNNMYQISANGIPNARLDVLENCNTIPNDIILSSSHMKEDIHVFNDIPCTQSDIQSGFAMASYSRNCVTSRKGMTKE